MKICSKCTIEKAHGSHAWCKECRKEYDRQRHQDNREKILKQKADRRRSTREWLDELKDKPCEDCNNRYPPCVMEWDHREDSIKEQNISDMTTTGLGKARILQEIAKCDLVCANCHRLRTFKEKVLNWS